MGTMLETIQNVVIPELEPQAAPQPDTTQPDDSTIESQLTREISDLWADNVRLSANRKTTAKEFRQIRARLAEKLATIKTLLSRPGRSGEWRGWLRERGIPRSTADRLVSRHAETLTGDNGNVPTEAISNSPEDSAEKLAETVWQRFGKTLATDESVIRFIGCVAEISGVQHEWRTDGLLILNAVRKAEGELPVSASATDPAPQLSDEVSATKDETAATPTETGQAAALADAGSGDEV